jgi:hypothetical protein
MSKQEHDWGGIIVASVFYGFIGLALLWSPIQGFIESHRVSCADESIPYSTNATYYDSSLEVGSSKITQAGVDGVKEVCTRGDGSVASTTVIQPAIDQEKSIGTKEPSYTSIFDYSTPAPAPTTSCAVTTCNDGTCSYSTGRGTCSWHGGVAYYN